MWSRGRLERDWRWVCWKEGGRFGNQSDRKRRGRPTEILVAHKTIEIVQGKY